MNAQSNHWITLPYEGVALWWATLPSPDQNLEALVKFGSTVVGAGKRHRVWDMHRYTAGAGAGGTFEQHARAGSAEGRLPLLLRRREDPEPSGVVSVYRDHEIAEVNTSDLGQLLSDLRPTRSSRVTRSASPVAVGGGSFLVTHPQEIQVTIRLDSDIWFPQVIGLREDVDDDADDFPDWYDNSALASRHTPRFNEFLQEVKAATIAAHGEWHFDENLGGIADRYLEHCGPDGIALPSTGGDPR